MDSPSERLLRLRQVMDRTGMGKSTIYRKIAQAGFPSPVSVGGQAVRWRESQVDQWIAALAPTITRPAA
jgi:prophage regulatory protein